MFDQTPYQANSTRKELWATNYPYAECETKLKLKKSIAAIILLEILEEEGKRESRRGKTREWIRKREEKEHFNNIVQEQIIEDTLGYREMMRLFYQTSNVYKRVYHDNKEAQHKIKQSTSLVNSNLIQLIRLLVLFLHFTRNHEQNMFSRETRSL